MVKMEDCGSREERSSVTPEPSVKRPKKPLSEEARRAKRENDRQRGKTRVNLGPAYGAWKKLRDKNGFRTDAEMAFFLINIYLRTKSENRNERTSLERSSSTETCESVHYEYPFMMSSSNEAEPETCPASPVQSSENGKESGKRETVCPRLKSQNEWTTTNQSENKENRDTDIQEDEDEEFSTSLSVGDGRYLVDLGSSSEFIVDEECILQLFKSCRECNKQCIVRKHVKGLKLVVYQTCSFCQTCCKWSNLPDDDDGNFQINGKDAAQGQADSTVSPSSNTS